ncbi:MAG: HAMP domain-containing sensor histidine kinase [Fusicatenibacter sp.]|nr:HAMP domain-containing sensor histidine kinase [Fusicatenibacter sp.]
MKNDSLAADQDRNDSIRSECRTLLSKVSHEIRNPVALINSFLQLLLSNHPELSDDCYYQKILENMNTLKDLLDELTSYNHSNVLHTEEVNPYLLLQQITADAGTVLESRQISVELSKQSAIPRIQLDPLKFQQLCFNLIRNATEAMPDGGTIRIAVSFDGDNVILTFSDEGCGIPKEDLPTLFDPFVTHKKNGTGLGLAICREIVTAHHGTISVHSREGEGAHFTVCLPLVP